jgi:hypothetical protein
MKRKLAPALCVGVGLAFVTAVHADPPDQARNDNATLHPGHQGHLSSGQTYPGKPATEFHENFDVGEPTYPTGPGGWAEQQSGDANAQRHAQ